MNQDYWQRIFDGFEAPTPLAFGCNDPPGTPSTDWTLRISAGASGKLALAAWTLLQSRYSGEETITVGWQGLDDASMHVLRLVVNEEVSVDEYIAAVENGLDDQLKLHAVSAVELAQIIGWPAQRPLFNSALVQTNAAEFELRGTGAFSETTLARVSGHFERLLTALRQGGSTLLKEVTHLSGAEFDQLLREWNPAPTPYPESTVQALFEQRVAEDDDAVALVYQSRRMTYGELNALVNRLAHYLIQAGVQPGQSVAIFLDRSMMQVIATLAILKTGAAYIPLDIEFPPDRIVQMLEDAKHPMILTDSSVASLLTGIPCTTLVELDGIEQELQSFPSINPALESNPDALAYIMYTSGSTGRPKGVEVLHRGIVRLVFGVDYIPYNADTVMLQIATVSFDATTFEMWGALLHGGTLVICPLRVPTLDTLGRLIDEHNVNTMLLTAAFFNLVIKQAPHTLAPLKYLLAGGEALSNWHVAEALRQLPDLRLVNAYGPTENAVISTAHVFDRDCFDPDAPIPIGRPIGNSTCHVLDRFLRPVPIGVPGELHVGGDGVARGYANRPDLTAERFIADPFSSRPGARVYKTGDQVYWNADGTIGFIGRVDSQIKIRGFRIEPQEIEATLGSCPGVEQAVVVVYTDDLRGKWLAGYVKVADAEVFSMDALQAYTAARLPDYMVPAALVCVAEWSFTPTGKLDRKALPKPELGTSPSLDYQAPENKTQQALAEIWQRVLQLDRCSIDDNFFDLGGDSLRGVQLFHEIQQCLGKELPLALLTRQPTIRGLAAVIDGGSDVPRFEGFRSMQLLQQGSPDEVPLFLIHGGAGNVMVFRELVERLPSELPIYAFQWSGWDGKRGDVSIEKMAATYKEELLRIHPEGPFRLGGYCIGGLIAIEIMRQFGEVGQRLVQPLLVWDSPNLESKRYRRGEPWDNAKTIAAFNEMKQGLERKRIKTTFDASKVPSSDYSVPMGRSAMVRSIPYFMEFLRWMRDSVRYLKTVPVRVKIFMRVAGGVTVPMDLRSRYCEWSILKAGKRYRSPTYGGHILYFKSDCLVARFFALSGGWWDDPFLGFGELCEGRFEAYAVGGGHTDILEIPEVADMVKSTFACRE